MKTGSLEGFVDRTWQVVHDSGELAAAVTSYTISGLNGDVDCKYRLISRLVNGYNGIMINGRIFLNNDSTSGNYGYQQVVGTNATVSAARATGTGFISLSANGVLNDISFSDTIINAKSGAVRTAISKTATRINGTAIEDILSVGNSWNNTVDNITSIVINAGVASGLGIGSRFILLKEVHVPSGLRTGELDIRGTLKGAWQEVYRHTVSGSAETSITVSGLKGNTTDQILRVRVRFVNGYAGSTAVYIRPNNVSTAGNYGYQTLDGNNTTASAARGTSTAFNFIGSGGSGQMSHSEALLYLKSGFVRTLLGEDAYQIATTTISGVVINGQSWNNAVDEITSLVILADQANGLGIGTEIVIERLNL